MNTFTDIIKDRKLSAEALREVRTYKLLRLEDYIVSLYNKTQVSGPGNTNVVNSWLAYEIGITSKKPEAPFQLEFIRSAEADIDIDFSEDAREVAYNYIRGKYGEDKVAWIGTHTIYRRKTVFVDVCSCMGINYHRAQEIGKECILPDPTNTIEKFSLEEGDCVVKDKLVILLEFLDKEVLPVAPMLKTRNDFVTLLNRLIGTIKTSSTHACGVAISSKKLWNMMPLRTSSRGVTTQLPVEDITNICHKIDLLIISTLTTIYNTIKTAGISIDDIKTDPIDIAVMNMIGNGYTLGIFQLGSRGLSSLCKKLHQAYLNSSGHGLLSIEDLAVVSALYRPGPRDAKMDEQYVKSVESGTVEAATPELTKCLEQSRGVILYQEDVIRIAIEIAGYDPRDADEVRQAVGKKKQILLNKHSITFIEGCQKHSKMTKDQATELWNHIITHGSYSFNKSHAIAYAYLSWYTAWLKYYYPEDFYAAYMNTKDDLNKVVEIIQQISTEPVFRNNIIQPPIMIKSPDINRSGQGFTPQRSSMEIIYGLDAIRGIGTATAEALINSRPKEGFKSIVEIVKISPPRVNIKTFEALVWSGALDSIIPNLPAKNKTELLTAKRNKAIAEIMYYIRIRQRNKQKEKNKTEQGRIPLPYDLPSDHMDAIFDPHTVCCNEQKALGRFVTMHPAEAAKALFKDSVENIGSTQSEQTKRVRSLQNAKGKGYNIIGIISNSRLQRSKNDKLYIRGTIEDNTGSATFLMFGKDSTSGKSKSDAVIGKYRPILKNGNIVTAKVTGHGRNKDSNNHSTEDPTTIILHSAEIIESSEESKVQIDAWDDDWGVDRNEQGEEQ